MVDSDIHVEALAKFGDVIIVIQGESPEKTKRFMCDSRVLVQASIYFEKLFGPNFLEGPLVASSSIPEIPLHEDDPGVMGVILAILHYREPPTEFKEKSPTWLAMLAIHCDKYDCTKPLQSTMNAWLRYCQGQSPKTTDYGHLLLAAYLFRDESQFFNISRSAQINLRPGFALEWEKSECLIGLPDALERDLKKLINQLLAKIYAFHEDVEKCLGSSGQVYGTDEVVCFHCGERQPSPGKGSDFSCTHCSKYNRKRTDWYCTREARVAEYFVALRTAGIWPFSKIMKSLSAATLVHRVNLAGAHSTQKHKCKGGYICPLKLQTLGLQTTIKKSLDEITGLRLYDSLKLYSP